jgi:putative intracellular protease/amidase
MHDAAAVGALSHTTAIADVDFATVDAVYLAGGHGTCADFVDNATLKAAIETVYGAGKPVAADCHGPIALAQCVKADGSPLVAGGPVTGFSDSEEAAVGLTDVVPFLIETKFKEQGGEYVSAADWNSQIAVAGNLYTGQVRPKRERGGGERRGFYVQATVQRVCIVRDQTRVRLVILEYIV